MLRYFKSYQQGSSIDTFRCNFSDELNIKKEPGVFKSATKLMSLYYGAYTLIYVKNVKCKTVETLLI